MDNAIKFIRIPLILTGFDIFNKSTTIWHTIRRFIFYLVLGFVILCFFYNILLDSDATFSDRIFNTISDNAFIAVMIQAIFFWHNRENVREIFKNIEELYEPREERWVEEIAKPLFAKCSKFLYKFSK